MTAKRGPQAQHEGVEPPAPERDAIAEQERLRGTISLLRAVLDALPLPVFWQDLSGQLLGCNAAFAAESQGRASAPAPSVPTTLSLRNDHGVPIGLVGFVAQLSEQGAALSALRESELRYRTLVEQAQDGIFLADARGRYLGSNAAFRGLLGYTEAELAGKHIRDMVDPSELAETPLRAEALRSGGRLVTQRRLIRKDRTLVTTEIVTNMLPDGTFEAIVRDVSERVRADADHAKLQEELRHAQKMESIGRLAGGIAHDFNNLLLVIATNAEVLRRRQRSFPALELDGIIGAAERGATLTRQLLSFSRKRVLKPTALDLNEVVRGLQPILERLMGENITLVFELTAAASRMLADAGQLEQVVMNLAVNARDACAGGGRVLIRTELRLEEAVLLVEDTGHGMDEVTQSRIFEPFFTTKGPGEGTGLGLSMVYGIVTQSGGKIAVRSALGQGSSFEIRMPTLEFGEATQRNDRGLGSQAAHRSAGILLVEDDRAVRETLDIALRDAGYRVFTAQSGKEALALHAELGLEVELVISDVVMPGVSGPALAQQLLAERSGLPVILMSGYSDKLFADGTWDERVSFLQKPFTLDQLVECVRELLQAR